MINVREKEILVTNNIAYTLLKNRNYTDTEIDHILNKPWLSIKDPHSIHNATIAAQKIYEYVQNSEAEIFVFGDYDVDGLMSVYIIDKILNEHHQGYHASYFPTRDEGYGLNMAFCQNIINNQNANIPILIITVDNGISCVNEIKYLKDHNIEVVVLDHHEAKNEVPDCIIVDPHGNCPQQEHGHLSGCGVTFKVCQIIQELYNQYDMMQYTPYVAFTILSDVMSLTEENMVFIRYGLSLLNDPEFNNKGLKELINYLGLQYKVTPDDLSWTIIPMLNACGRIEKIDYAYTLLVSENNSEIDDTICYIQQLSDYRKDLTKQASLITDSIELPEPNKINFIYLNVPDKYKPILGTIASKITELGYNAAIVSCIIDKKYHASARSNDINLQKLFEKAIVDQAIESYGGHSHAAACQFIEMQMQRLSNYMNQNLDQYQEWTIESDHEQIDAEITLRDIDSWEFYNQFNDLAFESDPVFLFKNNICIKQSVSKNNPKNIKYVLKNDNLIKDIWVWNHDPYILNNKNYIQIQGGITRDFMRKNKLTIRVNDIQIQ